MHAVKHVDVVVIGAGIIGLLCTKRLLDQGLEVALVERKELYAGATGAGQGYIWMAHRSPGTPGWKLAEDSIGKWREMIKDESFKAACEWEETGSLLLACNQEEVESLMTRKGALSDGGIESQILTAHQIRSIEPALSLPQEAAGLLIASDAQINGKRTAAALLAQAKQSPKFTLLMHDPVLRISEEGGGATVETSSTSLKASRGVILTAGVWSGEILSQHFGDDRWKGLLQPRRGHLIEVDRPAGMPVLKRGTMEVKYSRHYSQQGSGKEVDITFTATQSASGSLLIGSSREFSGWESNPSGEIIRAVMSRASIFLPHLRGIEVNSNNGSVRVGLRPYALGGLPLIGVVREWEGGGRMVIAAGHEGSGLALGPATAKIAVDALLSGSSDHQQGMLGDFEPSRRLAQL